LKQYFPNVWKGFAVCIAIALLCGCGSSSQRFTSSKKTTEKKDERKRRFASPIREEVEKDDKKIDVENIKTRFSSQKKKENTRQQQTIDERARATNDKSSEAREKANSREYLQSKREQVMEEILLMIGVPYEFGGEDENGIDCSAFTRRIYRNALLISLPRTSDEQMREGEIVQQANLHFGDLVFFNTNGTVPSHVGIFLEDDLFAHASESFGVTISSLQSSYYKSRYVGAKRIFK
jgi:cell wall-associated NlpC family hydrolase